MHIGLEEKQDSCNVTRKWDVDGDIPLELKVLTLPERVLVARYFPAAYIVKLYPKKKGARNWTSSGLHSSLRGNVSTYRLNTNQIAHLASSHISRIKELAAKNDACLFAS